MSDDLIIPFKSILYICDNPEEYDKYNQNSSGNIKLENITYSEGKKLDLQELQKIIDSNVRDYTKIMYINAKNRFEYAFFDDNNLKYTIIIDNQNRKFHCILDNFIEPYNFQSIYNFEKFEIIFKNGKEMKTSNSKVSEESYKVKDMVNKIEEKIKNKETPITKIKGGKKRKTSHKHKRKPTKKGGTGSNKKTRSHRSSKKCRSNKQ